MNRVPSNGRLLAGIGLALGAAFGGCGSDTSGTPEERAGASVKSYIAAELGNLVKASVALRAAAPPPDADGWNDTADARAVDAMKAHWKEARAAYEHVEGAIAVLFSDLDNSTDARYNEFVAVEPDDNLFDAMGVTGVHGVERILWAGHHPPDVVAFESALPNYKAAAFPATMAEAMAFRDGLCTQLVNDTTMMRDMFTPLTLDTAAAFRGVIGSLGEQVEKVELAGSGEEESRYAQNTLADMRSNLEGGKKTYDAFRDWVRGAQGGVALDTDILAGFARVETLYGTVQGDALPPVPAGFDPEAPTAEQLMTPYGKIFDGIAKESDGTVATSLVSRMNMAASAIGIPEL